MMRKVTYAVAIVAGLLLGLATGLALARGRSAGPAAPATDQIINFTCCTYTPQQVSLTAGEKVTLNGDFGSHPLYQVDGPASDTRPAGGFSKTSGVQYVLQFNTPGVYYFQCGFHGLAQFGGTMRGEVRVLAPFVARAFLPVTVRSAAADW